MKLLDYDEFDLNYNLNSIPRVALPNPLLLSNEKLITSKEEWYSYQRNNLIKLFEQNIYGTIPGRFEQYKIQEKDIDNLFLNSLATKKEIRIFFNDDLFIDLLIILPNTATKPVPVFLGMNFFGNQSILENDSTIYSQRIKFETDINFLQKNKRKKFLARIRFNKDSLLKADIQEDNMGYKGIVHGGERIYFKDHLVGRIQFNAYNDRLDLYEALAYLPIELYNSSSEIDVAIHQSFAKAKIIDFDHDSLIGIESSRWPIKRILNSGYGIVSFYYGDIDPDYDDGFENGIHPFFYKKNQFKPLANEWGSISAWASGLSYAMDYCETDNEINNKKVAVFGLSRLGKAALWASILDERFALAISGNSGHGGAAIWRRKIGETLYSMNIRYPHWLCKNSNHFNHLEEKLPVDQNIFLSLIAPRPVLIASASSDPLSDPIGEFEGAKNASDVYEFLDYEGLKANHIPKNNEFINSRVGYYIREGKHDITDADWKNYIEFTDKFL